MTGGDAGRAAVVQMWPPPRQVQLQHQPVILTADPTDLWITMDGYFLLIKHWSQRTKMTNISVSKGDTTFGQHAFYSIISHISYVVLPFHSWEFSPSFPSASSAPVLLTRRPVGFLWVCCLSRVRMTGVCSRRGSVVARWWVGHRCYVPSIPAPHTCRGSCCWGDLNAEQSHNQHSMLKLYWNWNQCFYIYILHKHKKNLKILSISKNFWSGNKNTHFL